MKPRISILAAVVVAASSLHCQSQTLNWGAPIGELLIDSNGDAIDDSFVFELGAFALDFDPQSSNVGDWLTHWRVFDALTYGIVEGFGFTTSTTFILNNVTSGSPHATDPLFSFAGLDAYIWIRKGDDPVPGSEWFLARATNWAFPLVGGDCCATNTIQWSVSDLGPGEVPEWGRQNDVPGPGTRGQNDEINGLQTHTFPIPEPSSALLAIFSGFGLLLRRRHKA
jgi:hypothetical protein